MVILTPKIDKFKTGITLEVSYTLLMYLTNELLIGKNISDVIEHEFEYKDLRTEFEYALSKSNFKSSLEIKLATPNVRFINDLLQELNSATTLKERIELCANVGMNNLLFSDILDEYSKGLYLSDSLDEFIGDLQFYYSHKGGNSEFNPKDFINKFIDYQSLTNFNPTTSTTVPVICINGEKGITTFHPYRLLQYEKYQEIYNNLGKVFGTVDGKYKFIKHSDSCRDIEYKYVRLPSELTHTIVTCKQTTEGHYLINPTIFGQLNLKNCELITLKEDISGLSKYPVSTSDIDKIVEHLVDMEFIKTSSINVLLGLGDDMESVDIVYSALSNNIKGGQFDFMDIYNHKLFCKATLRFIMKSLCESHPNKTLHDNFYNAMEFVAKNNNLVDYLIESNLANDKSDTIKIIPYGLEEILEVYNNIGLGNSNYRVPESITTHLVYTLTL
mgnify:CR=1 FL=1